MVKKDNTRLVVYTLQNCIYCNDLKGKLKQLGIDYHEKVIDEDGGLNNSTGDLLELRWKTKSYPIIEITEDHKLLLSIISKTDLEERKGIYIFETIEQIINKLKESYAL